MAETQDIFHRQPQALSQRRERSEVLKQLYNMNVQIEDAKKSSKNTGEIFDGIMGTNTSITAKKFSNAPKAAKACYSKIERLSPDTLSSILTDIRSAPLAQFSREVTQAILATSPSSANVLPLDRVVTLLVQIYPTLRETLETSFLSVMNDPEAGLKHRHHFFKVYSDLLIVKTFKNEQNYARALVSLVAKDMKEEISEFANEKLLWAVITYAGADLVGVNHGEGTIMDAVFQNLPPVSPTLVQFLNELFNFLSKKAVVISQNLQKSTEEFYEYLLKFYSFKNKKSEACDQLKEKYDTYMLLASKYGYVLDETVQEPKWKQEPMVEVSTQIGPMTLPRRIAEKLPKVSEKPSDASEFYQDLPIIESTLPDPGIKLDNLIVRLTNAETPSEIDSISRTLLGSLPSDQVDNLIGELKQFSKVPIMKLKNIARFIATANSIFPEVPNLISDYLRYQIISFIKKDKTQTRFIQARLIAELTLFNLATEDYFKIVDYCISDYKHKGSTEILISLITVSGKYLYELFESFRVRLKAMLQKIKQIVDDPFTKTSVKLNLRLLIVFLEGSETKKIETKQKNVNIYYAFIEHALKSIEMKHVNKIAKQIMKIMNEKKGVTEDMMIDLFLRLDIYSSERYGPLASLAYELSKVLPGFALRLSDIVCERIIRNIEVPDMMERQNVILSAAFLAHLVANEVVQNKNANNFMMWVLSYHHPLVTVGKMVIQHRTKKLKQNYDFFRIMVVVSYLNVLISQPMHMKTILRDDIRLMISLLEVVCFNVGEAPTYVSIAIHSLIDAYNNSFKGSDLRLSHRKEEIPSKILSEIDSADIKMRTMPWKLETVASEYSDDEEEEEEEEEEENKNWERQREIEAMNAIRQKIELDNANTRTNVKFATPKVTLSSPASDSSVGTLPGGFRLVSRTGNKVTVQ